MLSGGKHGERSAPAAVRAPSSAEDLFATLRQHLEAATIRPESVFVHGCPD